MAKCFVDIATLRQEILKNIIKQGYSHVDSEIITDVLMYAELRGNNQGIIKLVAGSMKPHPNPVPLSIPFQSPVSAKIDGGQNSGMVILHRAVEVAISKAQVSGVGIVGCSNYSSGTGALGVWAKMLADAGLIGFVMSQCPEFVAPHGSYQPIFGTNPLAIGIPTRPRPQVLDMATSACAYFGLVTAQEEGRSIPDDVAYDNQGHPTTDPAAALQGALRVFDRSFKGSHLALMVELLAGALTGAAMEDKKAAGNYGSLVIAFDPAVLGGPEAVTLFNENAMKMCERVKHATPLPTTTATTTSTTSDASASAGAGAGDLSVSPIWLPGERGDVECEENMRRGSISMTAAVFQKLVALNADCDTTTSPTEPPTTASTTC